MNHKFTISGRTKTGRKYRYTFKDIDYINPYLGLMVIPIFVDPRLIEHLSRSLTIYPLSSEKVSAQKLLEDMK